MASLKDSQNARRSLNPEFSGGAQIRTLQSIVDPRLPDDPSCRDLLSIQILLET